jgi:hypothetical protein
MGTVAMPWDEEDIGNVVSLGYDKDGQYAILVVGKDLI